MLTPKFKGNAESIQSQIAAMSAANPNSGLTPTAKYSGLTKPTSGQGGTKNSPYEIGRRLFGDFRHRDQEDYADMQRKIFEELLPGYGKRMNVGSSVYDNADFEQVMQSLALLGNAMSGR